MVFRIYLSPLAKPQADGTTKEYESFLVKYYEGARLVQRRKSSWDEVDAFVEEVVAAHRQQDPERLELTGMDRRIYLSVVEALKPTGKPVDLAAADFAEAARVLEPHQLDIRQAAQLVADALTRLKGKSIPSAIDFYERYGETMTETKSVTKSSSDLFTTNSPSGRLYSMRMDCGRIVAVSSLKAVNAPSWAAKKSAHHRSTLRL